MFGMWELVVVTVDCVEKIRIQPRFSSCNLLTFHAEQQSPQYQERQRGGAGESFMAK